MHTLEQLRSGALAGARHLKLACGLKEFPREIFELAETLEILDLAGNALTALPDDLPRLTRLRVLFCSGNPFEVLPEVLGACPALQMIGFKSCRLHTVPDAALSPTLRWLILTDNRLETLPAGIGRCNGLRKLALAGNRLTALPPEMAACTSLELVRIAANRIAAFPDWLLDLPRLTWLAYAGNPFCATLDAAWQAEAHTRPVPWAALATDGILGEGASGVIHRAAWSAPEGARAVAVKLFKGEVTSDGLPASERAACVGAGAHPQLIPVLGEVEGHPADTAGLVMALIDSAFRSLAGPPSLDTCTRDVYPAGTCFTPAVALAIARAMASVAAHLHQRGIVHGDLYAHNILHDGEGRVFLGDFGAASFVSPADPARARRLEQMEVRAFGCLLEELVAHLEPGDDAIRAALAALRARCLAAEPLLRPGFDEIARHLDGLAVAA